MYFNPFCVCSLVRIPLESLLFPTIVLGLQLESVVLWVLNPQRYVWLFSWLFALYCSVLEHLCCHLQVAELLKDRVSWYRDCRCLEVVTTLPTGNGGSIELMYMQVKWLCEVVHYGYLFIAIYCENMVVFFLPFRRMLLQHWRLLVTFGPWDTLLALMMEVSWWAAFIFELYWSSFVRKLLLFLSMCK